ncbi:hypothetical protein [Methylocella tundrae]|uniref:hypothetical protein n=1 Tax=Methylocella tundrae TaxID=227605 RepID=UPI00157A6B1A|nr:hypothetical protein [Methylocella tundrae]
MPSLIDQNPAIEAAEEHVAPTATARQNRTRKTLAERPKAQPKADRVESADAAMKRGAIETASAPVRKSRVKHERASSIAASKSARPAPTLAGPEKSETSSAFATEKPRAVRARSFSRRNREDAISLPPGQQWKRRLHPRAW